MFANSETTLDNYPIVIQFKLRSLFLLTATAALSTLWVVSEIANRQAWQRVVEQDGQVEVALSSVSWEVCQRFNIERESMGLGCFPSVPWAKVVDARIERRGGLFRGQPSVTRHIVVDNHIDVMVTCCGDLNSTGDPKVNFNDFGATDNHWFLAAFSDKLRSEFGVSADIAPAR